MHELAITQQILNLALRHAQEAKASRVTDLHLEIGTLSTIIDDSVQFYWDNICQGTICEAATLHFKRIPARLLCQDCNQEYALDNELTACPHCESIRVKILSGQEFQLTSIDIQVDDET